MQAPLLCLSHWLCAFRVNACLPARHGKACWVLSIASHTSPAMMGPDEVQPQLCLGVSAPEVLVPVLASQNTLLAIWAEMGRVPLLPGFILTMQRFAMYDGLHGEFILCVMHSGLLRPNARAYTWAHKRQTCGRKNVRREPPLRRKPRRISCPHIRCCFMR